MQDETPRHRPAAPSGTDRRPRIALVEPDMAPNVGAILRLGACLGLPVDVIEPCGFPFSPRAWRRQAMDYADLAEIARHDSWAEFRAAMGGRRFVALTTAGDVPVWEFRFAPGDCLLLGRESAGLSPEARASADARVVIPLRPGARSLNVGMAAAIGAAEALRQLALGDRGRPA